MTARINPLLRRVSPDEAAALLDDCRAYLAATGMAPSTFGYCSCKRGAIVADLAQGRRPTRQTVERVRAWMAAQPSGRPSAERNAIDAIASRAAKDAEAAVLAARRDAVALSRAEHIRIHELREARGHRLGIALQERMIDGPGDAIRVVRSRWPELWARVVATARKTGTLPGAVMADAIEKGLDP